VAVAAARAAADKQATDIVVLDVSSIIVITDHFVICTAGSQRQIRTVIDSVEASLRSLGVKPMRREGETDAGWWLLDYVDVVVHVFGEEERAYYELERLWSDAPPVAWEASDAAATGR
jgi:ribosome-associated protein